MHPEFGALIIERKNVIQYVVTSVLVGLVGLAFLAGAVAMCFARKNHVWAMLVAILAVLAVLHLGFAAHMLRQSRRRFCFYELGAILQAGKKSVSIPYAEATAFTYAVGHMNIHGLYVGSMVTLHLRAEGRRAIRFGGKIKATSKGFFNRTYKISDDVEALKEIIASQIADVMFERLLAGTPIQWTGGFLSASSTSIRLTPDGLIPSRGKYRRRVIPYNEVEARFTNEMVLSLHRNGEKRAFTHLLTGEKNFWPGYEVFQRMRSLSTADAEVGEPGEIEEPGLGTTSGVE